MVGNVSTNGSCRRGKPPGRLRHLPGIRLPPRPKRTSEEPSPQGAAMFHRTRLGLAVAAISLGLVAGSTPAATALPDWRTDRVVRAAADGVRMPKVVDLRYATHARFDRVVVDVRGLRPGFTVDYTRRLHREGSGH